MPRPRKSPHIPRAAAQLAIIMEGKPAPAEVQVAFDAVRRSLRGKPRVYNPVATFNRYFAAMKRQKPSVLRTLESWLRDATVLQELADLGQPGNREVWLAAAIGLQQGMTATKAFGVRPGPPRAWEFSRAHTLAARVEREHRKGEPSERALKKIMDAEMQRRDAADDTSVRRALSRIRRFSPDGTILDALCHD